MWTVDDQNGGSITFGALLTECLSEENVVCLLKLYNFRPCTQHPSTHIKKILYFHPDAIFLISVARSLRLQKSLDFLAFPMVHAD